MSKKILYLGLDPSRLVHTGNLVHFPIIQIVARPLVDPEITHAFHNMKDYTHLIFTSRTSVSITCSYAKQANCSLIHLPCIVIGKATEELCKENQLQIFKVAQNPRAEGIIALFEALTFNEPHFFFPHSGHARSLIFHYLQEKKLKATTLDLYAPICTTKTPEFTPDQFDVIVFTSPSTVVAYKKVFKTIPTTSVCYAIGPITANFLETEFPNASFCTSL